MSKTPWKLMSGYYVIDADGDVVLDDVDCDDLELIVAAVNFYTALPEGVRKLSPETVAKCVDTVRYQARKLHNPCIKSRIASGMIEADELEAEEASGG